MLGHCRGVWFTCWKHGSRGLRLCFTEPMGRETREREFVGGHQSRRGKTAIRNLKLLLQQDAVVLFMKEAVKFVKRGGKVIHAAC